ncbi:DsbA family protein [Methylocella sp. CPCC 101449]|uniref:DsbA family protein n=1 Tax=Methylocella sp. CPCC 101449 TaxID=2987531 RepID=UPI0028927B28|nr:DsbA family protein [Methylocella sp. CPCC 101449]MDT2020830.1 DsbA family protein [Methylocella sp. CPCC 101449]
MQATYLFDPLCGWCYGASPMLECLARLDGLSVALAPTGLFAGEGARPMDAQFAAYAWQNDQRIARLTGQPFTQAYRFNILDRADGLFDSAPATLGIVAVGLSASAGELQALKALQRGRYVEGRDTADLTVVAAILDEAGFAQAAARLRQPDEDLLAAYRSRIAAARAAMSRFGVNGVPALVVEDAKGERLLPSQVLFGDFDQLAAQVRAA